MGIVRADGRVATRNYIGILSSVNCSATVARAIADHFRRDIHPEALADYPNVDGVVALTHGTGCAVDPEGEGLAILRRTLAGYARHPNFAGVLDDRAGLRDQPDRRASCRTHGLDAAAPACSAFTIQETGGTPKTIARGIELIKEMLPEANEVARQPVPASHLDPRPCNAAARTAIPASPPTRRSGAAVDLLVRHGGTAILSETPEIYGAEHLLTRRAGIARGRREAGRAHPLVGGVLRAQRRRDEQQPFGRQQGRRPHHHPREVAGRRRPRAAPPTWSRSTSTPSRSRPRASSSWTRPATTR